MICPHCRISVHEGFYLIHNRFTDIDAYRHLYLMICPACERVIIRLGEQTKNSSNVVYRVLYPYGIVRPPPPGEVPPEIAEDYQEACRVLNDSPKASAALSRRCLQNILRDYAEVKIMNSATGKVEAHKLKHGDLVDEIQQVLDNGGLPSQIAGGLDAIRNIGNFAAHPIKSKSTGEIVTVEPGEAEWNLEVIESLFDYYFVQPAKLEAKRQMLNKKLKDIGKPAVK